MFLRSVCCCSWRCHCTFCCFVVFVNFFSSVSTTVFLDSCGQIICPASCLACLFFPGQNANISKSPHQPVQVQSPHISQRGFARILLWNFARCPLHPLRPFVFFKRFLKKHELHSLPALVAIAAENSLLFMAYGATQRLVSRMARVQEEELDVLGHGLAGGLKIYLSF